MGYRDLRPGKGRLAAGIAAGLVQIAIVAALVSGLAARALHEERETLTAIRFAVRPPAPSPRPTPRSAREAPRPEGRKGSALPREAPSPAIVMPAPAAAPTAQQGAAPTTAPGSGGAGTGSGAVGSGTGGGGEGGVRARRIAGALTDRDYPAAAARVRAEGVVAIAFRVTREGRVRDCRILRSSGTLLLDRETCRLVEQRFRYAPARDAQGQVMEDSVTTSFAWGPKD